MQDHHSAIRQGRGATPAFPTGANIPAGGTSRAGCAPFARRGETKGLRRKALDPAPLATRRAVPDGAAQ